MARNVKFEIRRGAGSSLEVLFGKVSLTPTMLHTVANSVVLPAPSTFDLVNGVAIATNVAPSPDPVGGQVPWAYQVKITDNFGKTWEYLVGVPDGTSEINFNVLPRYFETKPPLYGRGDQGVPGSSATIAIGTTTSGSSPAVTNSGTSTNAILNFTLAKGDKGNKGEPGVSSEDWANAAANSAVAAEASKQAAIVASQLVGAPSDEVVRGLVASPTTLTYGSVRNAVRDVVSDVSPESITDEAVKSLIETEGTQTQTALSAAIDDKIAAIPPSAGGGSVRSLEGALTPLRTRLWGVADSLPIPLVFAGDSLTQGGAVAAASRWVTMLAGGHALIETYAACLASGPNPKGLTFLNMGTGGISSLAYLKVEDLPTVGGWNPAVVIHNIGTNDSTVLSRTPEWVSANIAAAIDGIDAAATLPVGHIIVRPQERMDGLQLHDWDQFLAAFDAIAATRPNVGVLDLVPIFGALGWPDSDPVDVMDPDLIHPNINGNRLYHDTFAPILKIPKFVPDMTILSDNFNRANGTLIGSTPTVGAGVWAAVTGDFLIDENRAKGGVGNVRFVTNEGGTNQDFDLWVDAELVGTSAGEEIVFKALDSANHYTFNYGPTSLRIKSYIGGTSATPAIKTTGITVASGVTHRVHIRQRSNVITATMEGVGSLTYDNSVNAVSQATWSKVGFKSNGGGSYFDNLLVTKPGDPV